jgi:hypothetical protein
MATHLAGLDAPALVVLDGETEVTTLTGAAVAEHAGPTLLVPPPRRTSQDFLRRRRANRYVNPHWARHMSDQLGELLRGALCHEQTTTWPPGTPSLGHPGQGTLTSPPPETTPSPASTLTYGPVWAAGRPRTGHRSTRTRHARTQRPHRHRRWPLERGRAA